MLEGFFWVFNDYERTSLLCLLPSHLCEASVRFGQGVLGKAPVDASPGQCSL